MATGTLIENANARSSASPEQLEAWAFYGLPKSFPASSEVRRGRQVGEVRYVVGWASDQMSRMGWRVTIRGSEAWVLTSRAGERVVSNPDQTDLDAPDHPSQASRQILESVGWCGSAVRQVTTNLYVAGECEYVAGRDDSWTVVSSIHPKRDQILKSSLFRIRGLIPHPADPDSPDAPIFGVLPILEDIDWLNRLSRSQSANRVGMRGILGVADGIQFANGAGSESFFDDLNDMIHASMDDPEDTGMAILKGPSELIEQSGQGMRGLSLLVPNYPYDDKVDQRMEKLITRLAYGLPIPPEVLTGAQAASRATAFQIEEASYRAHIEPMAERIARVPEEALRLVFQDVSIAVHPDPTAILARRHSTQDALELFDRGAVSAEYLREVMGVPSSAAPDETAPAPATPANSRGVPQDPGAQAADEAISADAQDPITAAASAPDSTATSRTFGSVLTDQLPQPEDVTTLDELSEALDHIDEILLSELGGATQQATERVREKLGAAVRSSEAGRSSVPSNLSNSEVASTLGADALTSLGVSIPQVTTAAVEPLLDWWSERVSGAQATIRTILGDGLVPHFTPAMVTASRERLAELMVQHVMDTLSSRTAQPLTAAQRIEIMSLAGGAA